MTKQIKYLKSMICSRVIVDNQTNNISLIDVIEDLTFQIDQKSISEKPIPFPIRFDLVSFWKKEKGESDESIDFQIKIVDPKNKETTSYRANFVFPADMESMRYILKIMGFLVTISGVYKFIISYKTDDKEYKIVDEIPISVNIKPIKVLPK